MQDENEQIATPTAPAEAETAPAAPEAADAPAPEASPISPPKAKGPKIPLPSSLQEILGSLLFASESPLTAAELRTCVRGVAPDDDDDPEIMEVYRSCTNREIEQALHGLEKELERSACGFRLICAGGAYRLQTASSCGRYVRALLHLDRPSRLSRASLETLAIVAYRQPITKAEVEQIRGVAVDTIMKTLVDLQLVRLVGRSELPGHPFLYGTTPLFLEHFGLASLSELNSIDPTLQRSNPRERAKLFVKPVKDDSPTLQDAAAEAAAAAAAAAKASEPAGTETEPAGGQDVEEPMRSAGLSEEDEFIDDTPDPVDDDESLVDDDDESLVDDDDESLVDDDDESLIDDDEGDEDDDDDGEEEDSDDEEVDGE